MGSGQNLVYPLTQWELLVPISGSVPDRMPLTQWDAFLPRASPPDPILRSGLPECGIRALSPVAGAREAQGWRDPCLLLHGTAVSSGPRSSLGATRVSELESCSHSKLPSWERKQDRGCSLQRLVDLRSHRFRCFDQERFSPSAKGKGICKKPL